MIFLSQIYKPTLITKFAVDELQNNVYNNKIGLLKTKNKERINIEDSKFWGSTFKNDDNIEQNFYTQAYEKTITKTSTWTIILSIKEGIKFNFFVGEGSVEFTATAGYTNTKTETEVLKLPSQTFKVKPNSVANVEIILEKGTYRNTGILEFEFDMNKELDFGNYYYIIYLGDKKYGFSSINHSTISVKELIDILWKNNYNDYLKHNDNNTNSIFTVDNIDNTTKAYFNIPITWNWTGNNLIVNFSN